MLRTGCIRHLTILSPGQKAKGFIVNRASHKTILKSWSKYTLKVRNWVFSIPKRLRIYFLYDRKLLAKLSICAWNVITIYLKSTVPYDDAVPGASIAVQTYV